MKLKVNYTLEISEEYAPLIPIIASMEGWTPQDGRTAEEYINEVISTVVFSAIERYFGVVGKDKADAVKSKYSEKVSITSQFVDEESEPV